MNLNIRMPSATAIAKPKIEGFVLSGCNFYTKKYFNMLVYFGLTLSCMKFLLFGLYL